MYKVTCLGPKKDDEISEVDRSILSHHALSPNTITITIVMFIIIV